MKFSRRTIAFTLAALFLAALSLTANSHAADSGALGASSVGRPKGFGAGQGTAYAIWYKDGQWHVRVTATKGSRAHFAGRISVDGGTFTDGSFDQVEGKTKHNGLVDRAVVDASQKNLDFIFGNTGGMDGVDFKVSDSATSIKFALLLNNQPTKLIAVGADATTPTGDPFELPAHPAEAKPEGKKKKDK